MKTRPYVKVYLKEGDKEILEKIKHNTLDTLSKVFRRALYYYYENTIKQTKGNKK